MRIGVAILIVLYSVVSSAGMTDLSPNEEEILRVLDKYEMLAGEMTVDNTPSWYVAALKSVVKERFGIDDIAAIGTPDPRFATPELTWSVFKAALANFDMKTAARCYVYKNRGNLENWQSLGRQRLAEIVKDMRPIQLERIENSVNSLYSINRLQEGVDLKFDIRFIRVFGEWQIEDF